MKLWKKLLLCSVSLAGLCLACTAVIMACTDEPDPYDYYTSFFHADVQGKKDYGAFYFTDYSFTYGDTEPVSEAGINAQEWAGYLGTPVKAADVQRAMYATDSASRIQLQQHFTQNTALPDSLASNSFLQALSVPKNNAALTYYLFALKAEPLANKTYDLWNPAPVDTSGLFGAAREALAKAGQAQDDFTRLRYYYQAQRLRHYGHGYEQARTVYEQHIAHAPGSTHVKGWSLSCKAGEDRRLGDTIQAAYEFSKVFAIYPERRLLAYRNYHYLNAPLNAVMQLAKTPEEKANLYAIEGFANSNIGMENLEQVYNYAPSSAMVGVLMIREVNKLESSYLNAALANSNDSAYRFRVPAAKPHSGSRPAAKWPLILGIFISITGIVTTILLIRQQRSQRTSFVTGGIITAAGLLLTGWFAVQHITKNPVSGTVAPAQGSFFVILPDSVTAKYNAHIEALRKFCIKVEDEQKNNKPGLAALVNAYLYFMQNKPDDGLTALNRLNGQPLDEKLADQRQIIHLLLSAQRLKAVHSVDEQSLLPSLQWLDKKAAAGTRHQSDVYPETADNHNFFKITARNFYTYVLAPAYLRQGDTARAALALLKSSSEVSSGYNTLAGNHDNLPDFWFDYLHSGQLKQLINWRTSPSSDRYLTLLSSELRQTGIDKLQELLGTVYLREHRYQEAALAFRQIKNTKIMDGPYNGEDAFQGDPFHVEVNDYPKTYVGEHYTKLKFALKMAALQTQIKAGDADAYYQMANGLYNTAAYGNSWGLISYSWSSYDYGRTILHYYDGDYIKASLAKQYYLKARQLTRNSELQARCTFMAAKCEQKQYEAPSYTDYENYDKNQKKFEALLKQNSYFGQMQPYKNTAFYKQAVNECSYLRDFITR